jgi:hypothetical protein
MTQNTAVSSGFYSPVARPPQSAQIECGHCGRIWCVRIYGLGTYRDRCACGRTFAVECFVDPKPKDEPRP